MGNMLAVAAALPYILRQMQTWHKQYGDVFTINMGSKYMVVICSYKVQATEKRERLWAVFCLCVCRVLWKTL